MTVIVDHWTKDRCDKKYSGGLGLQCVKETKHEGKHCFVVEWNDWS